MIYTWHELNKALRATGNEARVKAMIDEEMAQVYPRQRWVLRMHCRLRRLRNIREAKELRRKVATL